MRACRCLDIAVFGHNGGCQFAGWRARTHSYVTCDCDACAARRAQDRADYERTLTEALHDAVARSRSR